MKYEEFIKYQEEHLPFGNPPITDADIWHFDFSEFKDDLIKSAKFYIDSIECNKYYLNVPCSICFTNDQTVNAKAGTFENRGLIVWNAGLLLKQCHVLNQWKEIEEAFSFSVLNKILGCLDNHVSILHFQIIQHFTFYHEFAHIIQMQKSGQGTIIEFNDIDEEIFYKHILEADADEFASLFLGAHIIQYCEKIFGTLHTTPLSDLTSVFLSGILCYAISIYPEDLSDFNIKTGKHPHPIFRLLFISLVLCEYINQSLATVGVHLNYSEILHNSLEISSKLSGIDLLEIWQIHSDEMVGYFKKIRETDMRDNFSYAVDTWNNDLKNKE